MCFGKAADRSEKLLFPYFDFGWHIFHAKFCDFNSIGKIQFFYSSLSTFKFLYCTQIDSYSGCYCISCRFFKNFFNYFYVCNSLFHIKNSSFLVRFDRILEWFFTILRGYRGGRFEFDREG